jgi:hypothetical protein
MSAPRFDPAQLRNADAAGLRHLGAPGVQLLHEACAERGFLLCPIDLRGCVGRDAVLSRFALALAFPDWFGGNWDALADALGDLGWLPEHDGYVLLLMGLDDYARADPDGHAVLVELLAAVADVWRPVGVPFWSLAVDPPGRAAD